MGSTVLGWNKNPIIIQDNSSASRPSRADLTYSPSYMHTAQDPRGCSIIAISLGFAQDPSVEFRAPEEMIQSGIGRLTTDEIQFPASSNLPYFASDSAG